MPTTATLTRVTTSAELLRDAYRLIESPLHWAQETTALDDSGNWCTPLSTFARRRCFWGAITAVARDEAIEIQLLDLVCRTLSVDHLSDLSYTDKVLRLAQFNDSHSHSDVLALLRDVIVQVERQD